MQKRFLRVKSREQKRTLFDRKAAKVILLLILFLAVFFIAKASQAITLEVGLEYAKATGLGTEDLRVTVAKIIRAALGFLGVLAVALILYGGFIWMMSQGDEAKVLKAKKIIRDAVIGLVIILSAFAIASFILQALMNAIYGGGTPPPNYGEGGGALGNGIIESHYPPRNAFGIPRNTSIVVTFKVPMDVESLVSVDDKGTPDNKTDDISNINSSILIHPTGSTTNNVTDVRASYTPDFKTFLFKPIDLLGSADADMDYTVELTKNILKFDKTDAFGDYEGYNWSFRVSTVSDITPPQIVSVIPFPADTVARNTVIQINFNEAINPMTIRGLVELAGGDTVTVGPVLAENTYDLINVKVGANYVAGEFMYGNQYQTVEFVTNDLCGQNTCGDDIYCLPGLSDIAVLVKAAHLEVTGNPTAKFPFTGLVDMADNSLDGNLNGSSEGSSQEGAESQSTFPPYNYNDAHSATQGDDAIWSFSTTNEIDLVPPEIETYLPSFSDFPNPPEGIDPKSYLMIKFNKIMMATTIKSDSGYGDGYCPCQGSAQCGTAPEEKCDIAKLYCVDQINNKFTCTRSIPKTPCTMGQECIEKEHITLVQPSAAMRGYYLSSSNDFSEENGKTTATIVHDPLGEDLEYGIRVASGVKDSTQNCYLPCSDNDKCVKVKTPGGLPGQYDESTPWLGSTPPGYPWCQLPNQLPLP